LPAPAADQVGYLIGRPLVGALPADGAAKVIDDEFGPLGGQLEGFAPPNTVPGTGDNGDLALE
jgi:hypothetical protein